MVQCVGNIAPFCCSLRCSYMMEEFSLGKQLLSGEYVLPSGERQMDSMCGQQRRTGKGKAPVAHQT